MKVMIDVDNTLCEFSEVLDEELQKVNKEIPNHLDWDHWDFYKGFITDEEFYQAAERAQDRILECPDIPGSSNITCILKSMGHKIVIASHRKKKNIPILKEWLNRNEIFFDEIHVSNDKTVLFDGSIGLVIEDSPIIIKEACKRGICTIGIRRPWNSNVRGPKLIMTDDYFELNPSIYEILSMIEV